MNFTPKNIKLILISIFIFSIATKLFYVFLTDKYLSPQLFEYEGIANNVLSGAGFITEYSSTYYRTIGHPLYPFLCIIIYFITNHSFLAVIVIQILAVALLSVIVFLIAKRTVGIEAGLLAAFLVATHPGLFVYSTSKLHPLSIDAFLFALAVLIFLILKENPTLKLSIFGGTILGICLLARSTIFLFFLLGAIWFFYNVNINKKKAVILVMITGFFAFLTILPWSIRNYKVYKRPVLILNNFGLNFWIGNNPNATGSALTPSRDTVLSTMEKDSLRRFYKMDEIQQGSFLEKEAFKFIAENPKSFLKLYMKKMFYFWWFSPQSGLEYNKEWLNIYKIYYAIILIFSALGSYHALFIEKNNTGNFLIFPLFIIISAMQSLFFVEGRHRWAIEPIMMLYVAAGILWLKPGFIQNKKGAVLCD